MDGRESRVYWYYGGQFYKKTLNFDYFKKLSNCIEIKFEIENVDFVRQKLWVENFESKILSDFKLNYNVGPFIFFKFKFLILLKLNYNGGQFY